MNKLYIIEDLKAWNPNLRRWGAVEVGCAHAPRQGSSSTRRLVLVRSN
ncbi:MAG: hypothetical protein MZU97_10455 [Bacillus subtilis]|nr:hypothetical protein [Bacillus subtilis]